MDTVTETRFVYLVDGEPYVGTVADVAHAIEQGHYAGLDIGDVVWTFDGGSPVGHDVTTRSSEYNADDYATVEVEIDPLDGRVPYVASYRIDGRA